MSMNLLQNILNIIIPITKNKLFIIIQVSNYSFIFKFRQYI